MHYRSGVVMKLTKFSIIPAVAIATLALSTAPVFAQQRDRGGDHGRSEGQAVRRSPEAPRRAEAPRVQAPAPRVETPRQVPAPAPRLDNRRDNVAPRYEGNNRYNNGRYEGHAVPRAEVAPRAYAPRGYAPRVYSPRVYAPHVYAYRPYAFRPRSRLSFGIYLGYGVPYAYTYGYPVPVYGYGAPSAPVYITPESAQYGGVALEITPAEAEVVVDGEYVGHVGDFDGSSTPLNLTAGRHHIELSAAGYAPLAFDVDVMPGQLIPYRGDMQVAY
jgi:PEGA domain